MKGYVKNRQREWRKLGHVADTGQGNVEGWNQLAAKFREMGWAVQRGGELLVT